MTEYPANPVPHKQIHPALQFLIVIGLLLVSLFVGTFIGIVIVALRYGMDTITAIFQSNLTVPHAITALWLIQFFGTTAPILATPLIFSYFIVKEPDDYIKNNFHFPWLLLIIAFVIMTFANPLLELLGDVNQKMVLPKFLKGVEEWMRKSEDDTKKLSDMMMQMGTLKDMIFDLLFIGLLTAVVEEVLFRGCLQTIFVRWMKNKHVAIWVVAILFSAFHMEFYGFLPRVLLGALFGYFTAWSGSIWPAIWGHFVNNGTVVVLTYLSQHKLINIDLDEPHVFNYSGYIISFVITLLLLWVYRYISNRWQIAHTDGEELD
jgi:membrane protease YdiL (CAAX protease family)